MPEETNLNYATDGNINQSMQQDLPKLDSNAFASFTQTRHLCEERSIQDLKTSNVPRDIASEKAATRPTLRTKEKQLQTRVGHIAA